MSPEIPEELLLDIDWSALTDQDKAQLLIHQTLYIDASRKFIHSYAAHGTDIRNLLLCMAIALVFSLFGFENKNIILSMLAVQTFFTLASKGSFLLMTKNLEGLRQDYTRFLKEKKKKNT